MGIEIERIGARNIDSMVDLLQERNHTLPEYTRWKYSAGDPEEFHGVLARISGSVVGCFGIVPRDLCTSTGQALPCGWFADWYVRPGVQGKGVGTALLRAVSEGYPIIFGHPGTAAARAICEANGYRPIGFQSWRRLILRPWVHERAQTRYAVKAAVRASIGIARGKREMIGAWMGCTKQKQAVGGSNDDHFFTEADAHGDWILKQPVSPDVSRKPGVWVRPEFKVTYVDDHFPADQIRRRVLFTSGEDRASVERWAAFVEDARSANCSCVEIFTTEVELDHAWAALGAWRYPDVSVLFTGKPDVTGKMLLHGWDRENWTYLAQCSTRTHR